MTGSEINVLRNFKRAEVDPYLNYCAELLTQKERDWLENRSDEISARWEGFHDELRAEEKRIANKFNAIEDLSSLETDLEYLDVILKKKDFKDDELLQIQREITWREHLYGLMAYNDLDVIEILKTDIKELPYLIIMSDSSIREGCQWKNSAFEEGLTWLPVPCSKTRISLGVVAPAALGIPICRVVANSSLARKIIATGEDLITTPDHHTAMKYAIEEFESVKLRKVIKQKDVTVSFLRSRVIDMENLAAYMFLALKSFMDKTMRTPFLVSMQGILGRLRTLVRSKWFWAAVGISAVLILGLVGQSNGWWDFPPFRWILNIGGGSG